MKNLKYRILLFATATLIAFQGTGVYATTTGNEVAFSEKYSDTSNISNGTESLKSSTKADSGNTGAEDNVGSGKSAGNGEGSGEIINNEEEKNTAGADAEDGSKTSDITENLNGEATSAVEEGTEEVEDTEEIIMGLYANSYIIKSSNVMMCTNTLGGRKFGTACDTTMAINLNEDVVGTSGIKGSDIISYAFQYIGNAYAVGGSSLTDGCDCSGFVMSVLANFGITVPHPSTALLNCGGVEISREDVRLGDVIIYNGGSHAAFYMGNDLIMDAQDSANGIVAGKRNAFEDWDGSPKNYVIMRFF